MGARICEAAARRRYERFNRTEHEKLSPHRAAHIAGYLQDAVYAGPRLIKPGARATETLRPAGAL
jgi:hypothetical protein